MQSDRRSFLLGSSFSLLALDSLGLNAQALNAGGSPAVADFWTRGMGVPPHLVIGGEQAASRGAAGPNTGTDFAREPLFLHYDEQSQALIPADQIPANMLGPAGDATVNFQLIRLRLNAADDQTFRNYTSGGIYLDMQQQSLAAQPQQQDWIGNLASSVFSAFFPSKGSNSAGGGKSGSSKGKGFFSQDTAQAAASSNGAPAATIPLQQARNAQSIVLPGGSGKTAFSAFAKGRRKTAFGDFLSAITAIVNSSAMSYLPLLSMPVVGSSALTAIRALVGNLQQHGGDQAPILQSPPMDVATNAQVLQTLESAVRLRTGQYIAIPQEQAAAMKDQLNKLKILDGFLVPKEAGPLDVFEAVPKTAPGISYLSLSVGVAPAKTAKG